MLHLLDANVLIDANRDYYPINRVPEFWDWLIHVGINGNVKMPIDTYEEVKSGADALADWAKQRAVENALLLREEVEPTLVQRVLSLGYAPDLTDVEIEEIGRDPLLIAYALADSSGRCIVTTEVSRPSRQRANRHIPDVCGTFGITCMNGFALFRALDFSTSWNKGV